MVAMGRRLGSIIAGLAAIVALITLNMILVGTLYNRLHGNEHQVFILGVALFDTAVIVTSVWLMVHTKD